MCGNDSQENGDVESPAATAGSASGHPVNSAVLAFRRLAIAFVRRYNQLEVTPRGRLPAAPCSSWPTTGLVESSTSTCSR